MLLDLITFLPPLGVNRLVSLFIHSSWSHRSLSETGFLSRSATVVVRSPSGGPAGGIKPCVSCGTNVYWRIGKSAAGSWPTIGRVAEDLAADLLPSARRLSLRAADRDADRQERPDIVHGPFPQPDQYRITLSETRQFPPSFQMSFGELAQPTDAPRANNPVSGRRVCPEAAMALTGLIFPTITYRKINPVL